jgi:hypothetical protein
MEGITQALQDLIGRARGDAVAQATHTRYLRIIRVKHVEAETGDELATAVREWFTARKEVVRADGTTTLEVDSSLSEERELMEWRYQVAGTTHHMMIFYAE